MSTETRPLTTPICQSTTFVQESVGGTPSHAYSRCGNPTVDALEAELGALEDAPPSVCFSTGLAAETALFLSLLKAGDHIVIGQAIYGGTVRLLRELLAPLGIESSFVDSTDALNVQRALQPNTKLVFIETPANPTLVLTDIAAVGTIARSHGVPLAVDNTFLTPVLQKPLQCGADISVYSTTKHIEGHSTALGGAITTRDEALLEKLRWVRKSTGAIQTPQNAWLTSNGLKTLSLRLKQHSENARITAEWLSEHPQVSVVNYPGLSSFPQRELAKRQHLGADGGVLSFELTGGYDSAIVFLEHVKLCTLVEHVGSVQTLLTHSASMTHADVPNEQLEKIGLSPALLRLSVGIEPVKEILRDLSQALAYCEVDHRRRA